MKKFFLGLALITMLFITGCGNISDEKIKNNFIKEVDNLKAYYLEGVLSLTNNEDTYKYDVEVSYKKDNNYKVVLTNQANKYQQIILKNEEGVYVITPSLNKSFKFQSNWPENNSQIYLLDSLVNDLNKDDDCTFEQKNNEYVFTAKVNYPNNQKYVKQNIILDKNNTLKKVEVLDEKDVIYMEFIVNSIDKKPLFSDNYFDLDTVAQDYNITTEENKSEKENETNEQKENETNDKSVKEEEQKEDTNETNTNTNQNDQKTEETSSVDDSIFPLYLPNNTNLANKETIKTETGERLIMTFSGDNPFILVQETVAKSDELTIIPTYGEPYMLVDTVGSLTDVSYTWTSNGIEYYIASDVMEQKELLEVAKSLNVMATLNQK